MLHGQNTARGARFMLGFRMYLILAQTDQVYLSLAFSLYTVMSFRMFFVFVFFSDKFQQFNRIVDISAANQKTQTGYVAPEPRAPFLCCYFYTYLNNPSHPIRISNNITTNNKYSNSFALWNSGRAPGRNERRERRRRRRKVWRKSNGRALDVRAITSKPTQLSSGPGGVWLREKVGTYVY